MGSGCRNPETVRLLGTLAATLQIPVVTTPKAKGLFPESNPLSLGILGMAVTPPRPPTSKRASTCCVASAAGWARPAPTAGSSVLQASDKFIQIDIDAAQIGKNYQVDIGVVGPANLVLRRLVSNVRRQVRPVATTGISYLNPEHLTTEQVPLRTPGRSSSCKITLRPTRSTPRTSESTWSSPSTTSR